MSINPKQIDAILKLPAPKKYSHFIKKVVGWQKLWALYDDGWAMSESSGGDLIFPMWPEKEYAALCASGDWDGYEPEPIELEEVLDSLIPMMREKIYCPEFFLRWIKAALMLPWMSLKTILGRSY